MGFPQINEKESGPNSKVLPSNRFISPFTVFQTCLRRNLEKEQEGTKVSLRPGMK